MTLSGYRRQPGRRNGGVGAIALAPAGAVAGVGWDRSTGHATAIEMREGGSFAFYRFKEGTARFTEKRTVEGGCLLVEKELSFALERLDDNQRASVEGLLAASPAGIVALVYNESGSVHLAGFSRRADGAFPLRVRSDTMETGRAALDVSGDVITLYGGDSAPSPLFTGTAPLNE